MQGITWWLAVDIDGGVLFPKYNLDNVNIHLNIYTFNYIYIYTFAIST